MNQKRSPKIVKVDLQPQINKVEKKHRKKIQVTKTKYTSPQDVRKFQKTFSSNKKQLIVPQIKQDSLVESDVKPFEVKQFSFAEEIQGNFHKIQGLGKGYEIVWKGQNSNANNLSQNLEKVGYIELNVGIKLFQLCQKNFQYDQLTIEDCSAFGRNLTKSLKAIYGSKNSNIILKKESQIVQSFKLIFYRKRSVSLHQVIMYLVDCNVMDQLIKSMLDIFPNQIKAF